MGWVEQRKLLYHSKKKLGLCTEYKCKNKNKTGRTMCEFHLIKRRKSLMKFKEKRKINGICIGCKKIAFKPHVHCEKHHLEHNSRLLLTKIERINNFKCRTCGTPLDEDVDKGLVTCFNCRTNSFRGLSLFK